MKDIIDVILKREGGYVNDPDDAGGETKYGISKRSFPSEDIPSLTPERARELYESRYVKGPGFDALPECRLKHQLVDFGVNSGPATAIAHLQRILGVEDDGIFGPITRHALAAFPDQRALNNLLAISRLKMLARIVRRNPRQAKFLENWVARATDFIIP